MRVSNSQETCRWKKTEDRFHSRMSPMCWGQLLREGAALRGGFSGPAPGPYWRAHHVLTAGSPLVYELCTRGSVLPHISQVGDAWLRDLQELSDKATGGNNLTASHCIPSLAGWDSLQRELELSWGPAPPQCLSTLPWDWQVKNIKQDWMTFLKEGRGIFSPWATGGRAGRRNRLAPYIM